MLQNDRPSSVCVRDASVSPPRRIASPNLTKSALSQRVQKSVCRNAARLIAANNTPLHYTRNNNSIFLLSYKTKRVKCQTWRLVGGVRSANSWWSSHELHGKEEEERGGHPLEGGAEVRGFLHHDMRDSCAAGVVGGDRPVSQTTGEKQNIFD